MRIISKKTLQDFWEQQPKAKTQLQHWYSLARKANWGNFEHAQKTFTNIDVVRVKSGNTVTVIDIGGNKYRLIAALHYNRQCCYVLRVLTHAEYDKGNWKNEL